MSENRVTKQTNDGKLVLALGKYYKSGSLLSLVGVTVALLLSVVRAYTQAS